MVNDQARKIIISEEYLKLNRIPKGFIKYTTSLSSTLDVNFNIRVSCGITLQIKKAISKLIIRYLKLLAV